MKQIFESLFDIVVYHIPEPFPKKRIVARDSWGNPLKYPRLVPLIHRKGAYQAWKEAVVTTAKVEMKKKKLKMVERGVPIAVGKVFYILRPKSVKESARPFPVVTPDLDNYEYAITNLLKGIAYADDNQIVMTLPSAKFYVDDREDCGVDIVIGRLTPDVQKVEVAISKFYKELKR